MDLDDNNLPEAVGALKDILYMYLDAIVQKGDFSELETGDFDPFKYLEITNPDSRMVYMTDGEIDLLRKGAAVALLARLANIYFEDECYSSSEKFEVTTIGQYTNGVLPLNSKQYLTISAIEAAHKKGLIIADQYLEVAFQAAFNNKNDFYNAMRKILEKLIKPCFIALAGFKK